MTRLNCSQACAVLWLLVMVVASAVIRWLYHELFDFDLSRESIFADGWEKVREEKNMNPGNKGHKGYKMSKIASIEPQGDIVVVTLTCGHAQQWHPYGNRTAEEYAKHIQSQESISPIIVGTTRMKCNQPHS